MRVLAIVQARMGSTRLPGKVLEDVAGQSMLARVVRRVQRARQVDRVVVATSTSPADEAIVAECERLGVACFRGDERDVLDRFYRAAAHFRAPVIVRITADCPLIEPQVVDEVVAAFHAARPDYASNTLERSYPRGLDTEVMSLEALARAWAEAPEPYHWIHVTPYFYQNPEMFTLLSVRQARDDSQQRWTVDTAEDLAFVRQIYERLGSGGEFDWRDVLDLLDREPGLMGLNRDVRQKGLHEG
ncbi:MAG TPA: glycosyltransferase family protein [Anaerolineae bacterium]|nr:glycosyltransferase family protein [Anaerolineae bacterium]